MTSSASRAVSFVAWAVAAFSFVCIILLNVGGVSSIINLNTRSRLGNPGFELLQWYFSGENEASVADYYHYRLYLNRICSVNPSQLRGIGDCYSNGILGSFRLSRGDPDDFVRSENAYDPILGKIDFATSFAFYLLAALGLTTAILKIPASIVAGQSNPLSTKHLRLSQWAAWTMLASAASLIVASTSLTINLAHTKQKMESIPQVSHVWRGKTPLGLAWSATAACIIAAFALSIKALLAKSAFRKAQRHIAEKQWAYEQQFFGKNKQSWKYEEKLLDV